MNYQIFYFLKFFQNMDFFLFFHNHILYIIKLKISILKITKLFNFEKLDEKLLFCDFSLDEVQVYNRTRLFELLLIMH